MNNNKREIKDALTGRMITYYIPVYHSIKWLDNISITHFPAINQKDLISRIAELEVLLKRNADHSTLLKTSH